MSVQPGPTYKRYAANGIATVYAIPFLLIEPTDLLITLDGTPVTSGFTLTGVGNPTSTCTFDVAPLGDLLFQLVIPFQRLDDYQENGDFLASTVNNDFDRLWQAVKELRRDDGRALVVSPLEPEGIPPLPVKASRALKMLAFTADGDPIPSNLTMDEIEQQPALAEAAAAAAEASASAASGSAASAANSAVASASSASAAQASADSVKNQGQPLGLPMWWPKRSAIPAGLIALDGQEISRATYPSLAAALDAGTLPTTSQATWTADPTQRGMYVAVSSAGNMRLPDLNGMSAGTLGALVLRGDGALSAGTDGVIQRDAFQGHRMGSLSQGFLTQTVGGSFAGAVGSSATNFTTTGDPVSDGTNGTPRIAIETRVLSVTGCWVVRAFGTITNPGSADAAQLASDFANLASRVSVLEGKGIFSGTAQATVSGTAKDFTGLPAGVKRLTAMIGGISTNGSSPPIVQLGSSAGPVTSGYTGTASGISSTVATSAISNGCQLINTGGWSAAGALYGSVDFVNISGNTWEFEGTLSNPSATYTVSVAGQITLPGPLDRIRFTTAGGTDSFDLGQANIMWGI